MRRQKKNENQELINGSSFILSEHRRTFSSWKSRWELHQCSNGCQKFCWIWHNVWGGLWKTFGWNFRKYHPNFFKIPLIHCPKINNISHIHGNITLMELRSSFPTTEDCLETLMFSQIGIAKINKANHHVFIPRWSTKTNPSTYTHTQPTQGKLHALSSSDTEFEQQFSDRWGFLLWWWKHHRDIVVPRSTGRYRRRGIEWRTFRCCGGGAWCVGR